jgi:hypothetical protein
MFVCCDCRVLSGRGLCDELIIPPEDSYRLWCVLERDLEFRSRSRFLEWGGPDPMRAVGPNKESLIAAPERPHYFRRMAQYAIKTWRQLQSSWTPQNWRSISLCLHGLITCCLSMCTKRTRLYVCDKWHVASWRHRVERARSVSLCYWQININGLYSGVFKDAVVAYFCLLPEPVRVKAKV